MTDAAYRAAEGVSNTMLGYLDRSPAHLQSYLAAPPPETPEFLFGRLFHSALLEPEATWANTVVKPDWFDGRTTRGKEWMGQNQDKDVIDAATFIRVKMMVSAVLEIPSLKSAIETGKR